MVIAKPKFQSYGAYDDVHSAQYRSWVLPVYGTKCPGHFSLKICYARIAFLAKTLRFPL